MQASIFDWFAQNPALTLGLFGILAILLFAFYIKKYIRIFDPNIFYVHLRFGKAKKQGEGGMVIRIPFIDRILAVDRTVQQLAISAESVLSKEKQKIKLSSVLQWQAENAIATINNVKWSEIPPRLTAIIESVIRTACAQLSVEEILEERQLIIEAIKKELIDIVSEWGLKVVTVELVDVSVVNDSFLRDMSKPREAEMHRLAQIALIEADQATGTRDIERTRVLREREIDRDKQVGVQEQEQLRDIQEAEKRREQSVLEINLQKDLMARKYEKQQAEVEAAKDLEVAKLNAEAEKQRKIKEEVEVQAQRILQEANAEASKISAIATAEAEQIQKVTHAQAEGIKKTLAAAKDYSPQAFARDFLKMLPEIYQNIDIGDVTLFGGGGGTGEAGEGGGGAEAFQVFGNVMLPMMVMAKMMGFDVQSLMKDSLDEFATKDDDKKKK
ncbi:MAG: SPFH domain-containing protein [Candidatus Thorarchaeota archaeon]|jgi:regulator of protease activity HflC (stomatin/prohibitin superfamily)